MTAASSSSAPPAPHPVKRSVGKKRCPHGRVQKSRCKDCGGVSFCEHRILRQNCKECGGSAFCEHGLRRQTCRDCGGSSLCQHDKIRHACAECQNFPCTIEGCPQVGHRFSSAANLLKHMRSRHSEHPKAQTKAKELSVYTALRAADIHFEYQKHFPFKSCKIEGKTVCAYADFAITAPWGAIVLEVDEFQHMAYDVSCDVKRDFDICKSLAKGSGHKVAILRYNPDSFRVEGKNKRVPTKDRQRRLIEVLRSWLLEDPAPERPLARFFLYYDCRAGAWLPLVAKDWQNDEAREISSVLPI